MLCIDTPLLETNTNKLMNMPMSLTVTDPLKVVFYLCKLLKLAFDSFEMFYIQSLKLLV